jgi:hypothetical protein
VWCGSIFDLRKSGRKQRAALIKGNCIASSSASKNAVLDLDDFIVGWSKHIADDLGIIRLVIDHQNALAIFAVN